MHDIIKNLKANWMGIICVCILACFMHIPSERLHDAFYISMIPVFVFLYNYWIKKTDYIKAIVLAESKAHILSVILSILFMILLPISDVCSIAVSDALWTEYTFRSVYILLVFSCLYLIILQIMSVQVQNNHGSIKDDGSLKTGIHFDEFSVYFYLISMVSILFIISCYPGLLHGDGWNIWNEVIGKSDWSDWHPVGFSLFCVVSSLLWKNPFSVMIVQTLIWIYVNWFALFFLNKYRGKTACKVYTLLSLLCVMSYANLHVLNKDGIFATCFLGVAVTILAWIHGERKKYIYIQFVGFAVLASLIRHMMIVPVIVPVFVILIMNIRKCLWKEVRYAFILLIAVFGVYIGIRQGIMTITHAELNKEYVKYSVAMEMMAAYATTEHVDEDSTVFMEQYIPLSRWKEAYEQNPYFADTISRSVYQYMSNDQLEEIGKNGKDIILTNWRFMTKEPKAFFKAILQQDMLCWRIAESDERTVVVEPRFVNVESVVNDYNPEYNPQRNFVTEILEPIVVLSKSFPIWRSFGYLGGIYVFMMSVCIGIMLMRKNMLDIIAMLPSIVLDAMLAITIPMSDTRYVLPIMQVGILFVAFYSSSLCTLFKNEKVENRESSVSKRDCRWMVLGFVFFVLILFVKDQNRIYQETILKDISFTFEDKKELTNSVYFPTKLYPDDDGVWFASCYTMMIPYRVKSNMNLSFEGYCCDGNEIIEVYVNGKIVDTMKKQDPLANSTIYSCEIPKKFFRGKEQQIEFKSSPDISLAYENDEGVEDEYKAAFYVMHMILDVD